MCKAEIVERKTEIWELIAAISGLNANRAVLMIIVALQDVNREKRLEAYSSRSILPEQRGLCRCEDAGRNASCSYRTESLH